MLVRLPVYSLSLFHPVSIQQNAQVAVISLENMHSFEVITLTFFWVILKQINKEMAHIMKGFSL